MGMRMGQVLVLVQVMVIWMLLILKPGTWCQNFARLMSYDLFCSATDTPIHADITTVEDVTMEKTCSPCVDP